MCRPLQSQQRTPCLSCLAFDRPCGGIPPCERVKTATLIGWSERLGCRTPVGLSASVGGVVDSPTMQTWTSRPHGSRLRLGSGESIMSVHANAKLLVIAIGFVLFADTVRAEELRSAEIFNQRILPIFHSPNPSSCVQCHVMRTW